MTDKLKTYIRGHVIGLLAVTAVYLVAGHYVKAYSDPVGFLIYAEMLGEGRAVTERVLLFPAFLLGMLKILGRDWVFLANLPLVLLLCVVLARAANLLRPASPSENRMSAWTDLIGYTTLGLFLIVNYGYLLEMLNPYREPLAFSLALGALVLLAGAGKRRRLRWTLAGLLLGLATCTRENGLLFALPMGVWILLQLRHTPWKKLLVPGLLLAAGGATGLSPFLIQNYVHSGSAMVPTYAAEKVEAAEEEAQAEWDIPIPGMSRHYFKTTGRHSVIHLYRKYTPAGFVLFLVGVAWACRRAPANALLLLGSGGLQLLFFAFYNRTLERYLLVVELFYVPFIAVGLLLGLSLLFLNRPPPRPAPQVWISLIAICILALQVRQLVRTHGAFMKVWDIADFRDEVKPRLKAPTTFLLGGQRHYAQILTWHLRAGPPYEPQILFGYRYYDKWRIPFTQRLNEYSTNVFARMSSGENVYYYGDNPPPFLRGWMDFEPALSFSELETKPDRYGDKLNGNLYEVSLWSKQEVALTHALEKPGEPHLLMLDLYRLMDFPGRSFCRLEINGQPVPLALTNGTQFAAVPASLATNQTLALTLSSDAPLPARPFVKTVPVRDPWAIQFGYNADPGVASLLSHDLMSFSPIKGDSCLLFDLGELRLPVYAETNQDVFASFRFEFFQEEPTYRDRSFPIRISSPGGEASGTLPGRRRAKILDLRLGRGTGDLTFVPVAFETGLPTLEAQADLVDQPGGIDLLGYVKIFKVDLVSSPADPVSSLSIDIGSLRDLATTASGFYERERHPTVRTARWTVPEAVCRLNLTPHPAGTLVRVHCVKSRPPEHPARPSFTFNQTPVPDDRIEIRETETTRTYVLRLDPDWFIDTSPQRLIIRTTPMNPARDLANSSDTRDLGLMIHAIDAEPEEAP